MGIRKKNTPKPERGNIRKAEKRSETARNSPDIIIMGIKMKNTTAKLGSMIWPETFIITIFIMVSLSLWLSKP